MYSYFFFKAGLSRPLLPEIVMWDLLVDVYGSVMVEDIWMEGLAWNGSAFLVPGHIFISLSKNPVRADL